MQRLKTALKAWPVITVVAMLLSFITKELAHGLFGITLESQASVKLVKSMAGCNMPFLTMTASIVIVMPILEEFVFRFLLWKLPSRNQRLLWAIPSSILFVAAHYIQMPWPDNSFIALFFFAMALCWLYKTTSRLWCPVLVHILFNATNLMLVLALPEKYLAS